MAVYDRFIAAFFAGVTRPTRIAHKNRLPAHRRIFDDGFWMQAQFEPQVIELQAQERTLPEFLSVIPRIDQHFFAVGRSQGLRPDRNWGMGHVSEDLHTGYPADSPERLRNRLVRELNDVYFWPLVGANVEADVHWDRFAPEVAEFGAWLKRFDRWLRLRREATPEARRNLEQDITESLLHDPVFKAVPMKARGDLYALSRVPGKLAETMSGDLYPLLSGFALKRLFTTAFSRTGQNGSGVAFCLKTARVNAGEEDDVIEFRRVPSHRDADEAAMWINLIEGRWRLARDTEGLVPLVRPKAPASDAERLEVFERYVLGAGANPLDFARFLPVRLAWRVRLKRYPTPRWAEVRRGIECENALLRTVASP